MISKRSFISRICFTVLCPRWVGNGECFLFSIQPKMAIFHSTGKVGVRIVLKAYLKFMLLESALKHTLLLICSIYIGAEEVPFNGYNFVKLE